MVWVYKINAHYGTKLCALKAIQAAISATESRQQNYSTELNNQQWMVACICIHCFRFQYLFIIFYSTLFHFPFSVAFIKIILFLFFNFSRVFSLNIAISEEPEFTDIIENVTVPAGRNVRMACSVKNLGSFKVKIVGLKSDFHFYFRPFLHWSTIFL